MPTQPTRRPVSSKMPSSVIASRDTAVCKRLAMLSTAPVTPAAHNVVNPAIRGGVVQLAISRVADQIAPTAISIAAMKQEKMIIFNRLIDCSRPILIR